MGEIVIQGLSNIVPGRRISKCHGSEVGSCLAWLKLISEIPVNWAREIGSDFRGGGPGGTLPGYKLLL